MKMSGDDNRFEIEYNSVNLKFERLNLPATVAFRVVFSSSRQPLVVARAINDDGVRFWTSIPEGRQKEAEGVGKFIDEYFNSRK